MFDAHDAKTATVYKNLVHQLEKTHKIDAKQSPHPRQGYKIVTQLQTVKMFCSLRRECHFSPQCLEEFANLNPDTLDALQGDNCNRIFWLFVAFPISSPQH